MKNRPRQYGFTLLEILIAVAIFSVMSTILYSAFNQFVEIRAKIETSQQRLEALQITYLLLGDDFRYSIIRRDTKDGERKNALAFKFAQEGELLISNVNKSYQTKGFGFPQTVKWEVRDNILIREVYQGFDVTQYSVSKKKIILKDIKSMEVLRSCIEEGRIRLVTDFAAKKEAACLVEVQLIMLDDTQYSWKFELPSATEFGLTS